MTLDELKARVIFQYNADQDDLDDYEPSITGYINAGYDNILEALTTNHIDMGLVWVSLESGSSSPLVPEWTHTAIADWATYMMYRNGNTQKQQRGNEYLQAYSDIYTKCKNLRGKLEINEETGAISIKSKKPPQFYNIYPPKTAYEYSPFED